MTQEKYIFQLDHVILLLPYDYLDTPPRWITDNFTVSPGGQHADGKTENRLVLFRDGTYLELIAFVNDDPEKRKGHWWDQPYGVIDWALGTDDFNYKALKDRLRTTDTDISYDEPKAGGRLTPDGKELKWEVTFPKGVARGNVPFFCTDVTPRERRVPITETNTTHPSGALGMAGMVLEVKKDNLELLSTATSAILDTSKEKDNRYETGVPNEITKLKQPTIRLLEADADSKKDLALTLVVQTADHNPRDGIRETIDHGIVSISFE